MLFDGWNDILRMTVVGVPVYAALLLMLRVTGKRALAKMNAFDLVISVALGSTLASSILTRGVTLAEGLFAFALLLALQFAVTWTSIRVPWFRKAITERPRLLLYRGKLLPHALRSERIARQEVEAAVRSSGRMSLGEVAAVVLENDGSFSVIGSPSESHSAMESVSNFPPEPED